MKTTRYEQFIGEMEKNGFLKVRSVIDEIYADLSDDDETISITARDCHMITIKGIKESTMADGRVTIPHNIYMKIYSNDGKELDNKDTVQFSITELRRRELSKNIHCCVYYNYPYGSVSAGTGIKLKKGISIVKDKKLNIKAMRKSTPLKIWKFELMIECDKWFRTTDTTRSKLSETITESAECQDDYDTDYEENGSFEMR